MEEVVEPITPNSGSYSITSPLCLFLPQMSTYSWSRLFLQGSRNCWIFKFNFITVLFFFSGGITSVLKMFLNSWKLVQVDPGQRRPCPLIWDYKECIYENYITKHGKKNRKREGKGKEGGGEERKGKGSWGGREERKKEGRHWKWKYILNILSLSFICTNMKYSLLSVEKKLYVRFWNNYCYLLRHQTNNFFLAVIQRLNSLRITYVMEMYSRVNRHKVSVFDLFYQLNPRDQR